MPMAEQAKKHAFAEVENGNPAQVAGFLCGGGGVGGHGGCIDAGVQQS